LFLHIAEFDTFLHIVQLISTYSNVTILQQVLIIKANKLHYFSTLFW